MVFFLLADNQISHVLVWCQGEYLIWRMESIMNGNCSVAFTTMRLSLFRRMSGPWLLGPCKFFFNAVGSCYGTWVTGFQLGSGRTFAPPPSHCLCMPACGFAPANLLAFPIKFWHTHFASPGNFCNETLGNICFFLSTVAICVLLLTLWFP